MVNEIGRRAVLGVTRPLAYAGRLGLLTLGLFVFAYGIAMTVGAGLGLSPWDVLHYGLSLHTPLTFGQCSMAVSGIVILASLLLRIYPWVATIANMLLVGLFLDLLLANHLVPDLRDGPLLGRVVLDVGGIAVVGIGSALYIKASLGAGPRDSLMLALSRRLGLRVALVRGLLEATACGVGYLLGGTVGVGTLLFVFGIGPAVDVCFRLFGVSTLRARLREPTP